MPRLLRVHFSSIGHADARLDPLTLDFRAREASGTGADTVLWLRNGGGKSTILNLFYSLFRPERRDFLGTTAEGRARHLEDYVKGDDLAFVVTEWDVDPVVDEVLFSRPPARRRVVGQVMSWRDHQRSSDAGRLRRRYFTMLCERDVDFDTLPIAGLGPVPVRSYDAFREWLDDLRQHRPELEPQHEDTSRRWIEYLEKIGLDPELFRYQLRMNAREGSADDAFRFRTTEEFIKFYLEIAFDPAEANKVSEILQGFRDKLARRPQLSGELAFLVAARRELQPLREAVAGRRVAATRHVEERAECGAVARAVAAKAEVERANALEAMTRGRMAEREATKAENDVARLGRWANGLERFALDLDLKEARAAREVADRRRDAAIERVAVARGAIARDRRQALEAERDAKADALRLARIEQEPLRREVARAGSTLRARLAEAVANTRARAGELATRQEDARRQRDACDAERQRLEREDAEKKHAIASTDEWLAERERERERLRADGLIALREEASDALARWRRAVDEADNEARKQETRGEEARRRSVELANVAAGHAAEIARLGAQIRGDQQALDGAFAEVTRLRRVGVLRETESTDEADLDAPGVIDRLRTEADRAHRGVLVASVDGAEDDRALAALQSTGRLPPAADVERALAVLRAANVAAWAGSEYLESNVADAAERERYVRGDPAAWHGLVVADVTALHKADEILRTFSPRMPVTVATPSLAVAELAPGRMVLPGHAAHWDRRAGTALGEQLDERRRQRERTRTELLDRQKLATRTADDVERWRAQWGDGRLAVARSDLDQRVAVRAQRETERMIAADGAEKARGEEAAAATARREAEFAATTARGHATTIQGHVARFEAHVERRRNEREAAAARRLVIEAELTDVAGRREGFDGSFLKLRDDVAAAGREAAALERERDAVDLHDDSPGERDLLRAREDWLVLREKWLGVVSNDRLQWEVDEAEKKLAEAKAAERAACRGREGTVAAVADQMGEAALREAEPEEAAARGDAMRASLKEETAEKALKGATRRREADDLPADEPPPTSAAAARERAEVCRVDRDSANQRAIAQNGIAKEQERRHEAAKAEAAQCELRRKRIGDAMGEVDDGPVAELPAGSPAVDALVDARIEAVRAAQGEVARAERRVEECGEALRGVALDGRFEAHRSLVRERLKAPPTELAPAADALHVDVEDRLAVVRADLDDIDQHKDMVLRELDKVAVDGVRLLRSAERASRLPGGLDAWENEAFLKINVDLPAGQAERKARLEPLLARLVEKAAIPEGQALVNEAVLVLGDRRIEATLLKPDAVLRRDRYPVMDMQAFSGGQKLTVQVLLYCTLARLRAQQRGRATRVDAGVLLLDNPVGTASSVALLELQRKVARKMAVQLVYTTGVNDPNAIATFPNTVRLKNAHMSRRSGDLHVTADTGVDAIRVVATT